MTQFTKSAAQKHRLLGLFVVVLNACGGGGSDDNQPGPNDGEQGSPSLAQRKTAVQTTAANNSACTSLIPFYWEIGDKNSGLASGTGGDNSSDAPTASTVMAIASASKWIFGAYVLEKRSVSSSMPLSNEEVSYLNFTSQYHSLSSGSCTLTHSVGDCFAAARIGGNNNDTSANDIGHFFYNGGHFQAYASNLLGLTALHDNATTAQPKLATEISNTIGGDIALYYSNPQLAGGVALSADNYARFLRKIVGGELRMHDYLGSNAVCTHTLSSDCPSALYSPVNQLPAPVTMTSVMNAGITLWDIGSKMIRQLAMAHSAAPALLVFIPGLIAANNGMD